MAAEDWERIKHVFSAALALPVERRDAYVLEACADQPDLRAAVADLLSAHDEASSSFLEPGALLLDAPWLFRTGDRVAGRFIVVRPIARGAMGEVYEANDERLRLRVALKAIRPQLVGEAATAERFRREVLVTRDIAHEGLCRVFDLVEHPIGPGFGLPEGTVVPCLTMQFLDGTSLEDLLRAEGSLAPMDALPLARQIAEALDTLHDRGIVHRDLKPSNVMLIGPNGARRAVLTDFGLAKPLDESLFETQTTVQGGAPFYMAPELFKGARPSRASDIYAFGLLIDEMVTRERAFSAASLHGLMLQKLQAGPASPSARAADLPLAWDRTILRCLHANPDRRFLRAGDVCQALEGLAEDGPEAPPSRRHLSAGLRRSGYAAVAGVAALGVMGAFAFKGPAPASAPQSVVVLPFKNLTENPQNDYLSTGTAGELSRRLSRVGGFVVYAPPSAGGAIDPSAPPTYALTGHVQQAGATLRITVQLTDGVRGALLWSENFEDAGRQPLQLEDAIATDAARALTRAAATRAEGAPVRSMLASLGLTFPFGRPQVQSPGTANNAAFDAYMRGRYLFEDRTLQSALKADEYLKEATALDPTYAAPYATLADLRAVFMELHYGQADELLQQAEYFATRAVAIDANLPDAQLSLAAVRQMQSRWSDAEQAFRRAIQLHPRFARAHRWFGGMLLQFGRFDECLQLMDRALQLDPYDYPSQSAYGLALFYAGRPEDAAAHLEGLLAKHDMFYGHVVLGQVYAYLGGQPGERRADYLRRALAQSAILREMETAANRETAAAGVPVRTEYADLVGALAWAFQQDAVRAAPSLRRLEAGRTAGIISPSFVARIYAVQDRKELALDALEQAERTRDRELMYLSVSPLYEHVRDESRFRALRQRMRLIQ